MAVARHSLLLGVIDMCYMVLFQLHSPGSAALYRTSRPAVRRRPRPRLQTQLGQVASGPTLAPCSRYHKLCIHLSDKYHEPGIKLFENMPPTLILIRHAQALHNVDSKFHLTLIISGYG